MKFVINEAFKIKEDCNFIKINKKSANWFKHKPEKTKNTYNVSMAVRTAHPNHPHWLKIAKARCNLKTNLIFFKKN